ncbi:MAG: hypothetical protein GY765_21440, partial [bacterium]|nr:hypothetical protein [bacterium]
MIRLGKRPPYPKTLKSATVEKKQEEIAKKIKAEEELKSKDFEPYWQNEDVKKSLYDYQHGKCCFCERKRDKKLESDVEHFRPKAGITEEPGHPGYWWLAYQWDNYFIACPNCNRMDKKNHFPLLPKGKRALSKADDLQLEQPVLIHPIDENPEDYIGFEWEDENSFQVKAVGLDQAGRGSETINGLTGINKQSVMEERADLLRTLMLSAKYIKLYLEIA